jgi:transposase
MSKKQKIYTAEFKAKAIKSIEANQGNVSKTARQLGISMQTLSNWNNKAKAGLSRYKTVFTRAKRRT